MSSMISSPHQHDSNSVQRIMATVLLALLPGIAALVWLLGNGVLINLGIAIVSALLSEWVFLRLRGRNPVVAVTDLSAVLTAVLLALALPPLMPAWQVALGTIFAIVVGKQLFGGIGNNPFNPAMLGYALLLISFPASMSQWIQPQSAASHLDIAQAWQLAVDGVMPAAMTWDSMTGATPLSEVREGLLQHSMLRELHPDGSWSALMDSGWAWISLAYLAGGAFLIFKGIMSWRIPLSLLASVTMVSGLLWLIDSNQFASPLFHLFSGAVMLGAFFIATDPVSASTTPKGQLIFGALIGFFIVIIRTWGGYPDAVAFSVLLLNMAAPTIDYYTQPRVFGGER